MNGFGSPSRSMDWEDVFKAVKAFVWNATMLSTAISGYLITVPEAKVPSWLLGIWVAAPVMNGIGVLVLKYFQDNRK